MNINTAKRRRLDQNGIALVAVLAFLSVLVVLAVGLLISMRTERLASQSAQDDVACRILLEGALSTAMSLEDQKYGSGTTMDIRRPKTGAITVSSETGSDNLGADFQLLGGEASAWIPRMYLSSSDSDYNGSNKAATAQWILVQDSLNPDSGKTKNIIGRFAYACFDCSGLIDANLISQLVQGNPMERTNGTNVGEISYDYLPEASGLPGAGSAFRGNRDFYHRFMAISEIEYLNDGYVNKSGYAEKKAIQPNSLNNLVPYSLCYDDGWWNWASEKWELPEDIRGWSESDAKTAFINAGFDTAQASQMAQCFVDYTDDNFIPSSMSIPCCEPVPMINEIIARARLELSGLELKYTVFIDVELWYPFLSNTDGPNDNQHEYQVKIATPPELTFDFSSVAGTNQITLSTPSSPTESAALNPSKPTASYMVTQDPFQYVFTYTFPEDTGPTFPIQVRCKSIKGIHVTATDGGTPSDEVDLKTDPYLQIAILQLKAEGFVESQKPVSLAVIDPRLNHLTTVNSAANWNNAAATKGAANYSKTPGGFLYSVNGNYEGPNMYVRNSTNLDSVAELGFIPTGDRWSTIDLFSSAGRILLNKYRACELTAKTYTNGLINPNTLSTNVIIAAFRSAPIENYPDEPTPGKLVDEEMAGDIAAGMFAVSSDAGVTGDGVFDCAAGWVTTTAFAVSGTLSTKPYSLNGGEALDNNQKEAIIRNTYRLFNPNQNLFTFVIAAQTVIDNVDPSTGVRGTWGDEDVVTAEKRAVALVWRDPFPGTDGRHEMFVKLFKYLDE